MFDTVTQYTSFFSLLILTALIFASRAYFSRLTLRPFAITAAVFTSLYFYLGLVSVLGVFVLAMYSCLVVGYQVFIAKNHRLFIWLFGVALGVMSFALAAHMIPGFNNPYLIEHPSLIIDGQGKPIYLNLDKAAVGLGLLIAAAHLNQRKANQIIQALGVLIPLTLIPVLLYIYITDIGEFSIQLTQTIILIMLVNLLFTCVAEEAFFRFMIQGPITSKLGQYAGILISAAVFGLAHLGAGTHFAIGATLAGVGYAFIFAKTNRIEASILLHWLVNFALTVFFVIHL